ncbi:Fc.00g030560.m01.CDS01 [Cosmosporella sp. VM-42]
MSQHRSPRRHHRRGSAQQPPPYILDFSNSALHPRRVVAAGDLRAELVVSDRPGWRRVVVLRSLEGEMGDVLGQGGDGRRGGWRWEFVDAKGRFERPGGKEENGDGDGGVRVCRASLWMHGPVYILLLDGLQTFMVPYSQRPRHRRGSSTSRPQYPDSKDYNGASPQKSALEEKLWDTLGDGRPLETVLANIVYESWVTALHSLKPTVQGNTIASLWKMLQSLESNADSSLQQPSAPDWSLLLTRLHQRIHLTLLLQPPAQTATSLNEPNSRSLDRIAYLGGLLLPLTVVSGILSIEGTYGPEGSAFWVFWVASGLSSLLALLVIHADNLRTLDVWIEEEILDPRHGRDEGRAEMAVQSVEDGGTRWKRRELGWVGAAKKMSGYYWWKGSPGMEWRVPEGWEERVHQGLGWRG